MLLLEDYTVAKLGPKNYELKLLFKDHSNNIQIRRHISNIRFEKSGIYYLYYNQYLNKYEIKNVLNENVYHFISILEIIVDLDTEKIIIKDYRKQQNNEENDSIIENIDSTDNSSDNNTDNDNIESDNTNNETKNNRGRRRKSE